MSTAMNILTGETISGEVRGNLFVNVKDVYTGEADVYEIGSEVVEVVQVEEVEREDDYPTELDNAFSDADVDAREATAAVIAEDAEWDAMLAEISNAAKAYGSFLDRMLSAVDTARVSVKAYASPET